MTRGELIAKVERLQKQLPDAMQGCTIRFVKCPAGHGRLTATNWVDHGCDTCEIKRLRSALERLALAAVKEYAALQPSGDAGR
jgi:hypothetical protein